MEQNQLRQTRILADKIRYHVLDMCKTAGSGHVGGSLSIADALADLYENQMYYDPERPDLEERDVVVLSKGHAGPALYAVLAEKGFFDPALLKTLNQGRTSLPSHPDRTKTPGVDMTTGSLGQGCSTAAGMALAQKLKGLDARTYLFIGDGELNEGQCWEAFQMIASRNLSNCIVLIDWNKKQLDGYTSDVLNPFDLQKKMEAFGFYAQKVKGNDIPALHEALLEARSRSSQPTCLILDTIKGMGVTMFEEMMNNHSVRFDNEEIITRTEQVMDDLRAEIARENA